MLELLLNVEYITSKHCFCILSPNNLRNISSLSIQLTDENGKKFFFSVENTRSVIGDSSIGISSTYAKLLSLKENSTVVVREAHQPPTIETVTISCFNSEDYSILELLAENVQSTLLQQIRILNTNQNIVIWVGNIFIFVRVCDMKPKSPGYIDNLTEVIIETPKKVANEKKQNSSLPESLLVRTVSIDKLDGKANPRFLLPFDLFIRSNQKTDIDLTQIYSAKLISGEEKNIVHVKLHDLSDLEYAHEGAITSENIFVSEAIERYFQCEQGTRILLEPITGSQFVSEVEIFPSNCQIVETDFREFLAENCASGPFILNQNITFGFHNRNNTKKECFLRFQPSQAKFMLVDDELVRNCKISVIQTQSSTQDLNTKLTNKEKNDCYCLNITNFQDIVDDILFLLGSNHTTFKKMDNMLLEGRSGSGKTSLVKFVQKKLNGSPYFYYVKYLNCKTVKGKSFESLHKIVKESLFSLIHCQPSVLILDDLHILCENTTEADPMAQNAVYSNRVSEMLEGLFEMFSRENALAILATVTSLSKLNKTIYSSRGNHLFKHVRQIKGIDRNDREELLKFLLNDYKLIDIDFTTLARKTESFTLQDLHDFVNKLQFECYIDAGSGGEDEVKKITAENCEYALEQVSSTFLDGVSVQMKGQRQLSEIGGLKDVKKTMLEMMMWPSKYPGIFEQAPLKLPTGLLLYGPPGTGKTILAGSIAAHCSLRLISVKGPELLSKYIGASEQAVRAIFERAESAAPAMLFFDEFDSLAPRRGHDSTGVTDRVVNQLLTQLDGVESLRGGVFVVAATSRPDLLDPALLRPGRLDRHVRCGLPDVNERLEILQVLSRSLVLGDDVDLAEVAGKCENFSGADLQAVLYTAHLDAGKYLVEQHEQGDEEVQVEITRDVLMGAVRATRPSLSRKEILKYERVYRKFEGGSPNDFEAGSRATLA